MIDLVTDDHLFPGLHSPLLLFLAIIAPSLVVGLLVAICQRKQFVLKSMFLILVWSCTAVALIRMVAAGEFIFNKHHSLSQVIIGDLFVFNVFVVAAILVTIMVIKNKAFRIIESPQLQ